MKINWFGQSCFYIISERNKHEKVSILIDPFKEDIGLKLPKVSADILIISHYHEDHSNTKDVLGKPFLIDGPGEYEIKGIFIKGIEAYHDDLQGKERGKTTIFKITDENIRICHLGDLGQKELEEWQLKELKTVDVLMIPVGGIYTISSKEAKKIISQIEPKIVIPMHYKIPKLKIKLNDVDEFLKLMGKKEKEIERVNTLILKERNLPEEGTKIVLMKP
jgi:L-ascorbate metabolism protein UlaG (beta-lactamase superfamily)